MIALLFAVVGAFVLAAQTLVIREYLVLHQGSELGVGLFYASWFAWIALASTGVLAWQRGRGAKAGHDDATHRRLAWLLALYPLSLAAQVALVRASRSLAGLAPDEPFGLADQVLWTFLTNAPVSVVTGLVFPAGCRAARALSQAASFHRDGPEASAGEEVASTSTRAARFPRSAVSRAVSRVYVAESVGAFAGGLAVTAVLAARWSAVGLGLGASLLLVAASAAYAWQSRQRGPLVAYALVAVGALYALSPGVTTELRVSAVRARLSALVPDAELLTVEDTPYQQAAVARRADQVLLLSNGKLVAALPNEAPEAMRAALVAVQPETLGTVLVVGAGSQGLVRALLAFPLQSLHYVEPDEHTFRALEPRLPAEERAALGDPRVHVQFGDGRRYVDSLGRGTTPGFDLVVVDLPDADTAALNRYFTEQFYQSVARLLRPGGVIATRVSSAANVLSLEQASYGASIDRTLRQAFRDVRVTPGEESWLFASNESGRVSVDTTVLEQRYRELGQPLRGFAPEAYRAVLDADRAAALQEQLDRQSRDQGDALLNRDEHPVSYLLGLLVMGRQLGVPLGTALRAVRDAGPWLFWVPLLLIVGLRLHATTGRKPSSARRGVHASAAMLAVGFTSIATQLVLTLALQARFGLLYERIGLVGALFMAGLAVGAALVERLDVKRAAAGLVVALCLMALWVLAVPWIAGSTGSSTDSTAAAIFYASFFATGAASGATLPLVGRLGAAPSAGSEPARASRIGALVEASDHWGAALGAAVGGTLLVPLLGQRVTCQLIAAVLVAVATIVVLESEPMLGRVRAAIRRTGIVRGAVRDEARARQLSFPWSRLSYVLTALAAIVVAASAMVRAELVRPGIRLDVRRVATFVSAARLEERDEPFVHVAALGAEGPRPTNVSFASEAVVRGVSGFGGPLNLLVSLDADGTLRRVELLESQETPAYVRALRPWLSRFEGRSTAARLTLTQAGQGQGDREIDGITGATVSCRAALETVNQATEVAGREIFGAEARSQEPASPGAPFWSREVVYLLVAFALGAVLLLRAPPWLRLLLLGANVVVAGMMLNVQMSLGQLVELVRLELPPEPQVGRRVLLVGVAALAIAFGPAYCALLCPAGATQELAWTEARQRRWPRRLFALGVGLVLADLASPWLLPDVSGRVTRTGLVLGALVLVAFAWRRLALGPGGAGRRSPRVRARRPGVEAFARYAKYLLLAAALVAMALGSSDEAVAADPLSFAFSRRYAPWAFASLAAILIVSTTHFRPFCRHLCPVGALLHLANKIALLHRLLPSRRYGACDLGVRSRLDFDCIQCSRCVAGHGPAGSERVSTLPEAQPGKRGRVLPRADAVLLLALASILALLAVHATTASDAASMGSPTAVAPAAAAGTRSLEGVDADEVRRLVGEGKLSDHEALHYRQEAGNQAEGSTAAPGAPAP